MVMRFILISSAVLLGFAGGMVCSYLVLQKGVADRQKFSDNHYADSVKTLHQCIYGENYYHIRGTFPENDARLDRWVPHQSESSITLSYSNGLSRSEVEIRVKSNGEITITRNGVIRSTTTLEEERCDKFFKRVISSGLLNYSDEVVQLKKDLAQPDSMMIVSDASEVGLHVAVPELQIDKALSIYAPDVELENFPDIVEFQLLTDIEKEIRSFLPRD